MNISIEVIPSIIITIIHCCPSYSSLTLRSGFWLRRRLFFQYTILLCVSSSLATATRGQLPLSLKVQQMQRCISTLDLLHIVCVQCLPPYSSSFSFLLAALHLIGLFLPTLSTLPFADRGFCLLTDYALHLLKCQRDFQSDSLPWSSAFK